MVFNATFNKISVIFVEKTTDLPHVTDKLYHIKLYRIHQKPNNLKVFGRKQTNRSKRLN
jgi:hypothetical protein